MFHFKTSREVSGGKLNIFGALKRSKVRSLQQFLKKSIFI